MKAIPDVVEVQSTIWNKALSYLGNTLSPKARSNRLVYEAMLQLQSP